MRPVFIPHTLDSLWDLLKEEPETLVYAGGTDMFVKLRQSLVSPPSIVCLERIEELRGVEDRGDEVLIGACSTHTHLLESPIIRSHFPVLTKALRVLGSPPVRNMGTIGGNICTASPAADTLPPLYVLKAEVEIRSKIAPRRMALKEFILGPGKTSLKVGEILYGIWVKKAPGYNIHHFEKVGQRKALSIAVVSLTALLRISGDGMVEEARLAWGSVAPTVVTSTEIEALLIGHRLSRQVLEKAAQIARAMVKPIDDIRASADYRRQVAGNLLLRLTLKDGKTT